MAERLYALAFLGAHLAFMPLLVLLLPRRVAALAQGEVVALLSWLLLGGALVASVAHMAAGWWSDRWFARAGDRRLPLALGLGATVVALSAFAFARTPMALVAAVIGFQLALNLMFAPLGALLADYVEDARKGRVAGMLNAALPLSNAGVALLAWLYPADSDLAFVLAAALVALCVLPLVVAWPFATVQESPAAARCAVSGATPRADFAAAWVARLLVQFGAALLIGYLFLFVAGQVPRLGAPPGGDASRFVGILSLAATGMALAFALAGGLLPDMSRRRCLPLAGAALATALALATLAEAPGWTVLVAGYAIFHSALAAFLAIDSALVAQLVSGHPRRGALLGVMNLTNTMPALIAPALALATVGDRAVGDALSSLLLLAAGGSLIAALAVLSIRSVR
ncbi:MFS transporter [Leptolyngbya sp. 15MV]|nr:MFS transporter [Leptolyngbya sp. 15MV]